MADGESNDPISMLLELGEPKYSHEFVWPNYRSYGIGREHIPALISIATNQSLITAIDESNPHVWAPIHAWHALGQLEAQEAIEPLMQLFHLVPDNDWVIEEMPDVFALFGPKAFQPLADYLSNPHYPIYSRMVAATSLMEMALVHSQVRDQSIAVLADHLSRYEHNSPGMNGVLIANLIGLEAVEQAGLIQKVFARGKVDRFIVGDWRDIKHRLYRSSKTERDLSTGEFPKNSNGTSPDTPA